MSTITLVSTPTYSKAIVFKAIVLGETKPMYQHD